MIPKIIHQTGPDRKKWHSIWKECSESWKNTFPDFQYMYWTDDDIRNLVKEQYSEFLELYDAFPHHIMRVDFARFCILHSYGGIYADLDMYCYKNFYDLLKRNLYIAESWSEWGEKVQNSLMISTPNQEFWEKCMFFSGVKFLSNHQNYFDDYILESCGPKLISRILDPSVKFLPKELFNPKVENQFSLCCDNAEKYKTALDDFNNLKKEKTIFTRHFLTGEWPTS
jgi:mannosyltransferase OCH1-like enzyme